MLSEDDIRYYQGEVAKDDKAMESGEREFHMVPKWLMRRSNKELSYSAKCVYGVLKAYCNMSNEYGYGKWTWVKNTTIAQEIGARNKSTVLKATKKLLDLELIGRIRNKGKGKGFGSPGNIESVHYLKDHPWIAEWETIVAKRKREVEEMVQRQREYDAEMAAEERDRISYLNRTAPFQYNP